MIPVHTPSVLPDAGLRSANKAAPRFSHPGSGHGSRRYMHWLLYSLQRLHAGGAGLLGERVLCV